MHQAGRVSLASLTDNEKADEAVTVLPNKRRQRIAAYGERTAGAAAGNPELRQPLRLRGEWAVIAACRRRIPARCFLVPAVERLVRNAINRESRIRHHRGEAESARLRIQRELRLGNVSRGNLRDIEGD